MHFTEYYVDKL